jgi:toxin ParE1/3/4
MGRRRDELGPALRSFPVGRYVIFYRSTKGGIEVARVLSAYRELGAVAPGFEQ